MTIKIQEGEIGFWLAEQLKNSSGLWVHVTKTPEKAEHLLKVISFCLTDFPTIFLPPWNCLPYDRLSPSKEILGQRMNAFRALQARDMKADFLLILTPQSLVHKVPESLKQTSLPMTYHAGDTLKRDPLINHLENLGFQRQEIVREPGEYAVRGSLLDIFLGSDSHPYRLDFLGDTLEEIKKFDALTQRTTGTASSFTLLSLSELTLTPESRKRFSHGYRTAFPQINCLSDPLYQAISQGRTYPGMEHWISLFEENMVSLGTLFPPKALSIEVQALHDIPRYEAQIRDSYATRLSFFDKKDKNISKSDASYAPLPCDSLYLSQEETEDFLGSSIQLSYALEAPQLSMDLERKTLLTAWTSGGLERLKRYAEDHNKSYQTMHSLQEFENLPDKALGLGVLPISHGFSTLSWTLLTEEDLFGKRTRLPSSVKRNAEKALKELTVFEKGDYVVHEDHGIGQYQGLEGINAGGKIHDCVLLAYADGDKLYVPVENMNLISRYGSEGLNVTLDKLGLPQWQNRKARIKKRIQIAAEQLMQIAAKRAMQQGLPCDLEGTDYFEAFCERFPYAETDDQLRAIEETCQDLMSDKPMDRLVCGDVGFGKTEVALRAAFLAASSGYQVALIVPTTLLARQHANTFQKRFEGTPFKVAHISRLVSRKEVEQIYEGLARGNIHIVISTHALLKREVKFQNLGLVIVDEEQHFGVAQKEKLKSLKSDVHVLTLSATPIPRTLQMALTGVRDMSLITTPPSDRLTVQTFVLPFDPVVVKEAILREHSRGGQIFYVCPRLQQLERMHAKLTTLVPDIRMDVAHGQMTSTQLENVMERFEQGAFDLLLSTNIVESGIDIATANTLIVHRSDLLGLAQLYQLRGRVGRGNIQGYAYFTTSAEGVLTPTAQRRLDVIQSLDYLGAGFTVASHDADIRGVGNLVGEEQSGHVREVGVELYQHMLEEAVEALKNQEGERSSRRPTWTPHIHFPVSLRIPETYIADLNLRLGLYRTLSDLKTHEEIQAFEAELIDRFGPFPEDVKNLLHLMALKVICHKAWIEKLDIGEKGAVITFYKNTFPHPDVLLALLSQGTYPCRLSPDHKVRFLDAVQTPQGLAHLQRFLIELGTHLESSAKN